MKKNDIKLYLAGGMLNRGEIMLREYEGELLKEAGFAENMYSPINNKSINDKKNANNNGLAERIFDHDTRAIMGCNVFVAEAMEKNLGTCMEVAQAYTMNYYNDRLREITNSNTSDSDKLLAIKHLIDEEIPYKHIYTHYNDIRMPDEPEQGFRRSAGYHQYLLGCVLKATEEYPMGTMEEVIEKIKGELINE
ncbi:MAG: hypothetical protein ACRDD7_16785 [Peptostreptococcaceae bacterium]